MKTLFKLLTGELKRMVSYKILPVSLVTSVLWIVAFLFLKSSEAVQIAPLLIFVDVGLMSVLLIGAAHHLERQEGTVKSMMVMPVGISQILTAKVLASLVLGLESTVVTCGALYFIHGVVLNYGLLLLFVVLCCLAHAAIGFSLALISKDFSSMLGLLFVYMFLFAIPSVLFQMGVIPSAYEWLMMLSPSYAAQLLITAVVAGKLDTTKVLVNCGYLLGISGVLFALHAYPGFKRHAVRG